MPPSIVAMQQSITRKWQRIIVSMGIMPVLQSPTVTPETSTSMRQLTMSLQAIGGEPREHLIVPLRHIGQRQHITTK